MKLKNIKSKGFTIVELLVVIVVIGILAAITVVSYTGVTTRADKSANQANANSVLKAAEAVYADTGAYPATNATVATVIANLNAGVAKVPSTLDVNNVTPTSGTQSHISYRVKAAPSPGVCVGYWDQTLGTPATVYLYGGGATADNGTTCS